MQLDNFNLLASSNSSEQSSAISAGCNEPNNEDCDQKSCSFGGSCVELSGGSRCDCARTSFSGSHCSLVETSLQLNPGLNASFVIYEFNPAMVQSVERVIFGFQLWPLLQNAHKTCSLIQIQSRPMKQLLNFYLEPSKDGRLILVARIDTDDKKVIMRQEDVQVNDGYYHLVQFERTPSGKVTFDLDFDHRVEHNSAIDLASGYKNIVIGLNSTNPPLEGVTSFSGIISGLHYNGVPLLDILAGKTRAPGVQVLQHRNLRFPDHFSPNLQRFPSRYLDGHLVSSFAPNDDAVTQKEQSKEGKRLITVRPECRQIKGVNCKPSSLGGIIVPRIEEYAGNSKKDDKFSDAPKDERPLTRVDSTVNVDHGATQNEKGNAILEFLNSLVLDVNMWLIVAISACCLLTIVFLMLGAYRCRKRDQGTFNLPRSRSYLQRSSSPSGSLLEKNNQKLFGNTVGIRENEIQNQYNKAIPIPMCYTAFGSDSIQRTNSPLQTVFASQSNAPPQLVMFTENPLARQNTSTVESTLSQGSSSLVRMAGLNSSPDTLGMDPSATHILLTTNPQLLCVDGTQALCSMSDDDKNQDQTRNWFVTS
ncbi:Neurexin [Cichlidogyrus casuarinus]|uniref:Neurexin n=1 Tax=Cichlidogyrus casuarinus TaxID=1844966 RepID=A0ABD2QDN2_9PLAT